MSLENVITELTAALKEQTAVGRDLIAAMTAKGTAPATPAKAKKEKPAPVEEEEAPPAQEDPTPAEEPTDESSFPTDRAAGLDLIANIFKAKLKAATGPRKDKLKDAFKALRDDFGIETIHNLDDDKIESFHAAMIDQL